MCKKFAVGAVIVAAIIAVLGTTYGSFGAKKAKDFFKGQVTPETRIEMLREEISQLDKDTKKYVSEVAKETVAVEKLRDQIAQGEDNHKKQLELIRIMREDLALCEKSGERFVCYGDQKYSVERVKTKLARDWDSYKKAEETLKSQKELLKAREISLTAARERLEEIRGKKHELEVEVAQLEAELKSLRLAETRSKFHFDDSRAGNIRKEIAELKDELKAKRVELEMEGKLTDDPIPVGKKNTGSNQDELFKEIDSQLEKSRKTENPMAAEEIKKLDDKLTSEK